MKFAKVFACCLLILALPTIGWGQADLTFSSRVSVQISRVDTQLSVMKQAKSSLRPLFSKLGELPKKSTRKARSLSKSADSRIEKIKNLRKDMRKLLRKAARLELVGRGNFAKLDATLSRLANQSNTSSTATDKLNIRIQVFVRDNQPKPAANFRGSWRTNFGEITFAQTKRNVVTGTFFWNGGGTVTGRVKGNVLSGRYRGSEGNGTFTVTMNPDGQAWAGAYKTSTGFNDGWAGVR